MSNNPSPNYDLNQKPAYLPFFAGFWNMVCMESCRVAERLRPSQMNRSRPFEWNLPLALRQIQNRVLWIVSIYVLRKRGGVLEQCVRETRTIEDTYPPPPLERRVKTKLQLEPQQQVKKTKTVLRELNRLDILVVFNVPVPSLPSIAWWC